MSCTDNLGSYNESHNIINPLIVRELRKEKNDVSSNIGGNGNTRHYTLLRSKLIVAQLQLLE